MNRISTSGLLLVMFAAVWLTACGDQGEVQRIMSATRSAGQVDQSLLTPEADGTFSMADTPTPVPSATSIPEPTPTQAPTATPEATLEEIYWDDVVAALDTYYVAYHTRSQSTLDRVTTAATSKNELYSVEQMQNNSAMTRGWIDYPDIEIVEVTHLKCDEVLCKIWYDAISKPPVENPVQGQDFPFDFEDYRYFRLVDGNWLEDHTHETWHDEWDSTHRP